MQGCSLSFSSPQINCFLLKSGAQNSFPGFCLIFKTILFTRHIDLKENISVSRGMVTWYIFPLTKPTSVSIPAYTSPTVTSQAVNFLSQHCEPSRGLVLLSSLVLDWYHTCDSIKMPHRCFSQMLLYPLLLLFSPCSWMKQCETRKILDAELVTTFLSFLLHAPKEECNNTGS